MLRTASNLSPVTKHSALVTACLRPYVDRIWGWESAAATPLPVILPGTGAELIFHYRAPFERLCEDGRRIALGQSFVFCARSSAYQLAATGPVGFVAVRLRCEALRHFAKTPLSEWIDGFASIEDCLGGNWADVPSLLAEAQSFGTRAKILEECLASHLASHERHPSLIDQTVRRLYYNAGSARVATLAADLHMSVRHFERLFCEATGLTPKRFQRIARFHHVMRHLMIEQRTDYLDTALAHGFYDQAHFIHECRDFTGRAPGALLTPQRFLSHFYNPRLPG